MNKENLPDFSGKCLSIRLIHSEFSHDLYDPKFEYQGGKLFLIGTIPEGASDSDWDANQTGAVAWDLVRNYVLFNSLEEYSKSVEISHSFQENSD